MLTAITNAQVDENSEFQIEVDLTNPSREINDGVAEVKVQGGKSLINTNGVINLLL